MTDRFEAARWFWYAALLEASGLGDIERGSGESQLVGEGVEAFSVRSASRGIVELGRIPTEKLEAIGRALTDAELEDFESHRVDVKVATQPVLLAYAQSLDEKLRAKNEKRARNTAERHREILKLHAAGRPKYRIAQDLGISIKTVQRHIREAETATRREMSG